MTYIAPMEMPFAAPALAGRRSEAPATPVVGTPQQEAFWREIVEGRSNIVLMARAGTGKTFSIIEAGRRALQRWPRISVTYVAYNTHIAKELKGRVPGAARSCTSHSLGLAAITRHVGQRLNPTDTKVTSILNELVEPDDKVGGRVDRMLRRAVVSLVGLCKANLIWGTPLELTQLAMDFDIELDPKQGKGQSAFKDASSLRARVFELVPEVLRACAECVTTIDFDDMIWLPVVLNLPVEECDLLFIDEAQDLNRCRQQLLLRACPRGRIVIVGDNRQAIYAFQGADSQSMATMEQELRARKRGCVVLPLTYTRRCPSSHVALAQQIVPDIEAMPEAPIGVIARIPEAKLGVLASGGDMIICRTNAPLVAAMHQFLRAGKRAVLRGKDLSGQIRDMIAGFEAQTIQELEQMVRQYELSEAERMEEAGKSSSAITAMHDRCETLLVLMEGCRTLSQLDQKIDTIFNRKEQPGDIILSSVHGAKGLEADTIFILAPHLMPHPAAKSPRDLEQEANIKYVALTRSKSRLVFVDDDGSSELVPALTGSAVQPTAPAWCHTVRTLLGQAIATVPESEAGVRAALGAALEAVD